MATVRKSVIVPHSCETMFDLVDGVERYPEFLPWCPRASVLERTDAVTRARIDVDYHGLKTHLTTRNAKSRPHAMQLEFVDGPFESFKGEWRFTALGAEGCRVEFALDYALAAGPLQTLLTPLFGQIVGTMVERFVERADKPEGARRR